jgi:hypothetical protein
MLGVVGRGLTRIRAKRQAKPSMHFETTPWAFVLWWLGLLVLHCANIAYYIGVALLYKMFDKTYLDFQFTTYGIGLPSSEHGKIATIHAVIGAIHVFFVLLMVTSSLHARKLVFQPDMRPVYKRIARTPYIGKFLMRVFGGASSRSAARHRSTGNSDRVSSSASISHRMSDTVRSAFSLFAHDGLFGVDSIYFDHVLLVREIIETSLQSYQLYRMTLVLPRLWLIRLYVALLVANCWAVPFLHRYYRNRETTRRMLCLLCDAVLDMLSSVGVSVIIFATYAPQYVDPHFGFSFIAWFDDEWISNMQHEFQIMVVASWGDMVSRLVFAFGLVQCMDAIKEMLVSVAALPSVVPTAQQLGMAPSTAGPGPTLILPSVLLAQSDDIVSSQEDTAKQDQLRPSKRRKVCDDVDPIQATTDDTIGKQRDGDPPKTLGAPVSPTTSMHLRRSLVSRAVTFIIHVVGPGMFVLWGFTILIVHITAESHLVTTDCSLRLKPWFSTKPGCSLVEINCAALHSNGHDAAFGAAWDTFDPNRAARVVIRHCPELHVSSKIAQYRAMTGFKIYNSTVLEWDAQAAVTETNHASLRSVLLLRTKVPNGELPAGLLSMDFPKRMNNFFTSATNLRSLPSNLDETWPRNMLLVFETSLFTEIPAVFVRLQPNMVSMANSPISIVPTELLESPNLTVLQIGLTRVQELPLTLKYINPIFTALFLQHTNVTIFPAWLNGYANFIVHFPARLFNAYGTPFCRELDEIIAGNRQVFSLSTSPAAGVLMDVSTPEKLAFVRRAVDCSNPEPMFYFPLPVEDIKHGWRP